MPSRRSFLTTASLASLSLSVPSDAAPAGARPSAAREPVRPKALVPGATVAIVSPASPEKDADTAQVAVEAIASLGFAPKLMPNATKSTMYLAGTDAERASDLNAAFRDPSVSAVWCVRGGYGSGRLLPLLDWEAIARSPKPLIGFSDITALLNGIHARTGLVTFHGPNAGDGFSEFTLSELKRVLMKAEPAGRIAAPPPVEPREGFVDRENRIRRVVPGKGRGRLVGGNLSVFDTLVGTPYEPPLDGALLFLEEIGEEPYRIDRWLTHLVLSERLRRLAGIAIGKCRDCVPAEKSSHQGSWSWQDVVAERLGSLGVPMVVGLRFGHVPEKSTLPVGVLAELDADAGTLTLLEAAVR